MPSVGIQALNDSNRVLLRRPEVLCNFRAAFFFVYDSFFAPVKKNR